MHHPEEFDEVDMPQSGSWSDWHQELDQVFDAFETMVTQITQGQPRPDQACDPLSAVVQSSRQRQLIWFYDIFGVIGVAHCVYLIALEEIRSDEHEDIKSKPMKRLAGDHSNVHCKRQKLTDREHANSKVSGSSHASLGQGKTIYGHSSWHKIVNDYLRGSESRILFMLTSIPAQVLEAILWGNLPERMQDANFRVEHGSWLSLEDTQGTYAAYVAVNSANIPSKAGKGLTLQDMLDVTDKMLRYISTEVEGSAEVARHIDNQFDPGKNRDIDYELERKFGCGSDGSKLDRHKSWLRKLHSIYSEREETLRSQGRSLLLEEHLSRCIVYCGASGNCLRRGPEHWTLRGGKNTSPLWGLFLSTVRSMYGNKYTASNFTYQILRTVHEGDIGLDEILTTLIHSGYWWDLGANITWAGTATPLNSRVERLRANAVFIQESGHQQRNIQESIHKIKTLQEMLGKGQSTEADDVRTSTDVKADIVPVQQMMHEVEHYQALIDQEELTGLFHKFEDASI